MSSTIYEQNFSLVLINQSIGYLLDDNEDHHFNFLLILIKNV